MPLSELTEKRLTQWRRTIAMSPRYHKTPAATDDEIRARRATAQRLWQGFHAVLAYAFKKKDDTGVTSNEAWQGIEGLRDIEKPREGALTVPECKRLINAVDAEFRPMVQAALLTGARYGALASLRVKDFDPGSGTVQLQSRKGYGSRLRIHRIVLTAEGVQFFKAACAGRGRNDLIFTRDGGGSWNTSHQQDLVAEACARAGIDPPVTFHELKHTYVSLCLMNGMSIETVSANTATSVPTLLKHYAHLVQAFRVKQVNEHAPTFGIDTGNVAVPP